MDPRKPRQDPVNDARFYESLIKPPHLRTPDDIRNVYEQLRQLDTFSNLFIGPLKALCKTARYERHPAQYILFRDGDVARSWYILLSGSVFIENQIYMPYGCFGKRTGQNHRRTHNCLLLQESEMIVIDYPTEPQSNGMSPRTPPRGIHHSGEPVHQKTPRKSAPNMSVDSIAMPPPPVPPRPLRLPQTAAKGPAPLPPRGLPRTYPLDFPVDIPTTSSSSSNTSYNDQHRSQVYLNGLSADEDTLVRVKHRREKSNSVGGQAQNGISTARRLRGRSTASSTTTEGETASNEGADSDEDEGSMPSQESSSGGFMDLRDSVRECLEKEPSERNSEDLAVLLDFMQHMSAFAALPMSIKRQLCLKMVFAVVNDAGTVVLAHNEKLDSWSVIVNGCVEVVKPSGERVEYKLGDSFGAEPTPATQIHIGEMRTMVDDCEFVLVEHRDFCSIMSTIGDHIEKDRDGLTGEVVSEVERRTVGTHCGQVLIKGKPDKLIHHLVDERDHNVDPHYVDDFLLTYRVFIRDPTTIFEKLMLWFADSIYRDKVARLVLLWVNNHFNDFETNDEMWNLLERFEGALERDGMHSQLSLLNIACSVKAKPRQVILTRRKDDKMMMRLVGGQESGNSVYVAEVFPDTSAAREGVKRADEMLEVNQQSAKYLSAKKAEDLLTGSLSLTLMLKNNVLGYKETIGKIEHNKPKNGTSRSGAGIPMVIPVHKTSITGKKSSTTSSKSGMMEKLMTILKSSKEDSMDFTDEAKISSADLRPSRSNPDITSISQYYGPVRSECPEHVLKIYRNDQTFKYLPVYKETSAQNVVQLALQEFNMTAEGSPEWSLCECTVTIDGVIKQRRLPPQMENLAERIALNSRYYLKNNSRSEPLVPDELAPELLKEAQTQLLSLNAQVVAAQLTLQDFSVFSAIEPTEFLDNLFKLDSKYGSPKLEEFEQLFNREMWWVATEICTERHVQKRAKLIKKFIKVARYCRDLRNFNSMFAIMSGLDKPAVRRLHSSWERVSSKYIRMLDEIHQLVDPSRNMSKYRQHLAEVAQEPPVVPIYPVIKKDLTFAHDGNATYSEKLINFEKLRLIAKSIRGVMKLSSAPYEIASMAERSGGVVMDALLHMNSFENSNVATMRKGMSGKQNQPRKKVYEQALMVRKVKSYLEGLHVVDNEMELDSMSYDIEPQVQTAHRGANSSSTANIRRVPSPTPSSLSSQSAGSADQSSRHRLLFNGTGSISSAGGGSKFGVESPQAVQKMLSLVQNSKVKGAPPQITSPSTSARSSLQRNMPRVTGRQATSSAQGPVQLNEETSTVTTYYQSDNGRRQRSGSEGRFDNIPPSTFYLTSDGLTVSPRQSLSVVIPTHPHGHSPTSPRCRSRSPASSGCSSFSTIASIAATSMAAAPSAFVSNPYQHHQTVRGHVIGHRPMPIVTSGSATLPNHVSPRGLPPKSRPTILPGSHTNSSSRMGTIKEATFLTSEQVSRV
ncbi:Rap guanine nucleotide exchange factor [Caenorhabditis elegans]|uniref:Rap guanine nucleotide exchange factor n=4 Tax=Caenorhabditis elegans TaxID=6239 RepID=RPGF_CAEEL|nr:Rap guanine nucleotide exchange factor [Caenorhabditis elegans]G5EDB9.1 RecName: Full=Rap guanine nucleotide exchange factor; Short=RA-GEF; AltName: Full=PDZ-domain-containing exchange factor [Caenorhabditis elegans]AAF22963.1 RA-GEF [Caenorhabditis elegans]AAL09433.1 PXF isoform A [Caenorhabditis elegans]CAA93100.2 Rap guanine nucleotide exchange factor [Caenorhabditis elegans]|eukprot:NP_001023389.1 Rap guanine nucleotide exchange factor [Caenorhabditis elegans]